MESKWTPEAIRKLIEDEIGSDWDQSNAHNCNLRECLILPEQRVNDDANDDVIWLVQEEHPGSAQGYHIVFGENHEEFGLACNGMSEGQWIFLGY